MSMEWPNPDQANSQGRAPASSPVSCAACFTAIGRRKGVAASAVLGRSLIGHTDRGILLLTGKSDVMLTTGVVDGIGPKREGFPETRG
jgi:hypothetical protein